MHCPDNRIPQAGETDVKLLYDMLTDRMELSLYEIIKFRQTKFAIDMDTVTDTHKADRDFANPPK